MIEKNRTERKGLRERIFARGHLSLDSSAFCCDWQRVIALYTLDKCACADFPRIWWERGEKTDLWSSPRVHMCADC